MFRKVYRSSGGSETWTKGLKYLIIKVQILIECYQVFTVFRGQLISLVNWINVLMKDILIDMKKSTDLKSVQNFSF